MAVLHTNIMPYKYAYQAAAAQDVVVKASPGFLHGIVVGAIVSGGTIAVSDHATDGEGNICVYFIPSVAGTYIFDMNFETGITANQYKPTNITYIYY